MNAEFPGPSLVYAVSQVRLPGQAGRTKQAQRTYQAPVALCILDFMLYSPSCPGRGCSHSCDTDEETQGGTHPLFWPPPAPPPPHPHPSPSQGDQTHGLSARRVQMSFLSQPQRKLTPSCGLSHPFSPSTPPFLPLPTSFLPALGYSLCRKGPRTQGKAPRSSCPGQDTCFLHQLAPSALPGGRKSDPGLGNMGALHGGQSKVILSLPLPPARAQPEEP